MRILLVESEESLQQTIIELALKHTFEVDAEQSVHGGVKRALANQYSAVVLDSRLQDGDGLSVLAALRDAKSPVPVMVISDAHDVAAEIAALDAGADDYVAKPFEPELFAARLGALTRRMGNAADAVPFGDVTLSKKNVELQSAGGKTVKLSLKEFQILELLFESPHQVITKKQIIKKIWGTDTDAEYNNVEVYISFIRKKMEKLGAKTKIRTTRGVGYSLEDGAV